MVAQNKKRQPDIIKILHHEAELQRRDLLFGNLRLQNAQVSAVPLALAISAKNDLLEGDTTAMLEAVCTLIDELRNSS